MTMNEILFLGIFIVLIAGCLTLDLGVFNKNSHIVSVKESLIFTVIWIGLALGFFFFLRFYGHLIHGIDSFETLQAINIKHGHNLSFSATTDFAEQLQMYRNQMSLEFITGYVIEYAMSIDNIFVILLIFTSFGVKEKYYHRVLFWGILGAIVMRFLFIFVLSGLIHQFEWILAVFGIILLYTAIKMFVKRNEQEEVDTKNHRVVKFVSKHFAVCDDFREEHFFVKENGKRMITPLFLVLIVIEFSDIIFAVDSVPAIFSVTKDQYLVFFSNIFAIIGLRSLFFLLSNMVQYFRFLKPGLSVLLAFIGIKMLLAVFGIAEISTGLSLIIIVSILVICILLSVIFPHKNKEFVK
ncbi:MAG: TerC/Alx family metal homeostasis membrane protein [Bacteroidales bacterium]|nr:TerC/Alx family metal homeostasis membrane protein [Bacteroidales bacterium]